MLDIQLSPMMNFKMFIIEFKILSKLFSDNNHLNPFYMHSSLVNTPIDSQKKNYPSNKCMQIIAVTQIIIPDTTRRVPNNGKLYKKARINNLSYSLLLA